MSNRTAAIFVTVGVAIGVLISGVVVVLAGNPSGPGTPPGGTLSYSLEDVYQRLASGAQGSQDVFTEPSVAPGTSTMHTLNDAMTLAPSVDDTSGATVADVASGKTFWGLTTGGWGFGTGTSIIPPFAAAVPKTGQTTSYSPGDDGDLERGVPWPNPRFTDNLNGTVLDNLTGLIWLKNANCTSSGRNWPTALSDVAQLNASGTMNGNNCGDTSNGGGHQADWRLPSVRELYSLVHIAFYNPSVPNTAGTGKCTSGDPFTGIQLEAYWSGSTLAGDAVLAWGVWMGGGFPYYFNKADARFIWPVRGGQ